MIGERLRHAEHDPLARRVCACRVIGDAELRDAGLAARARVVDEQAPVLGKSGMGGQTQETALATGNDAVRQVEERRLAHGTPLDRLDAAGLLDDEEPLQLTLRNHQSHRGVETRRDQGRREKGRSFHGGARTLERFLRSNRAGRECGEQNGCTFPKRHPPTLAEHCRGRGGCRYTGS